MPELFRKFKNINLMHKFYSITSRLMGENNKFERVFEDIHKSNRTSIDKTTLKPDNRNRNRHFREGFHTGCPSKNQSEVKDNYSKTVKTVTNKMHSERAKHSTPCDQSLK